MCECQEEEETVEYFLLRCPRWREKRIAILGPGLVEKGLTYILNSKQDSRKAIEFLLKTERLEQFREIRETTMER